MDLKRERGRGFGFVLCVREEEVLDRLLCERGRGFGSVYV